MMSQFDMNQMGRTGGIDVKAEDIDIIIGEDMVCQLNMNQVGRMGRIDVKADDIIDIIDGYKGRGYDVSNKHELGGQDQRN